MGSTRRSRSSSTVTVREMPLILDTTALLWLLAGDSRLGPEARERVVSGPTYISAVSVIEVEIKTMLGRLSIPEPLAVAAERAGLAELPLTVAHAEALSRFVELARHDPFDRMLLAQARVEGAQLLTSDAVLLGLGHAWVIDARS